MTARELLRIINNGNDLNEVDYQSLVKLRHEFPYFVLPAILAAKYQHKYSANKDNEALYNAATQSPDRKRLKFILENKIPFLPFLPDLEVSEENIAQAVIDLNEYVDQTANADESMSDEGKESQSIISKKEKEVFEEQTESSLPARKAVKKKRSDVLKELEENLNRLKSSGQEDSTAPSDLTTNISADKSNNENHNLAPEALMDAIKMREEKDVSDGKKQIQDELIDEFNKKTVKFKIVPNMEDVDESTDLSIESTRLKENLISESFAKILVRQKKLAEAREIYQKLQLKFPEKKAYFADCLKQLEDN